MQPCMSRGKIEKKVQFIEISQLVYISPSNALAPASDIERQNKFIPIRHPSVWMSSPSVVYLFAHENDMDMMMKIFFGGRWKAKLSVLRRWLDFESENLSFLLESFMGKFPLSSTSALDLLPSFEFLFHIKKCVVAARVWKGIKKNFCDCAFHCFHPAVEYVLVESGSRVMVETHIFQNQENQIKIRFNLKIYHTRPLTAPHNLYDSTDWRHIFHTLFQLYFYIIFIID